MLRAPPCGVMDGRGRHAPAPVLVPHAVFEACTLTAEARCRCGSLHSFAVFRMDLFAHNGASQFLGCVTKNLFVGRAVVKTLSFHVHDSDHVGGVLRDKAK